MFSTGKTNLGAGISQPVLQETCVGCGRALTPPGIVCVGMIGAVASVRTVATVTAESQCHLRQHSTVLT